MELYDFVQLIKSKKKTIFSILFTVLVLTASVNFILPKKYGSELKVLIIQNNLNNADPYLVSKSSEHLGNVLGKVIFSGSFYQEVIDSGFGVSESYFGDNFKEQLKGWSSSLSIRNVEDTGILEISAKHREREQAELMVEAIGYNLKANHTEYHGSGENVRINIINKPVTSNFPVEPNIVLNMSASLLFGLFFSFIYIYLFPDPKYDIGLLPERKKKTESVVKKRKALPPRRENGQKEEAAEESDDMGGYFDEEEVYQEEEGLADNETESLSASGQEDDLDLDYDEIERGGNIRNIL